MWVYRLYIDPGPGSMLFAVLIGIIGAALYSLRMLEDPFYNKRR